jgi:hypothetical protein
LIGIKTLFVLMTIVPFIEIPVAFSFLLKYGQRGRLVVKISPCLLAGRHLENYISTRHPVRRTTKKLKNRPGPLTMI